MYISITKCDKCGYIWPYRGKKTGSTCPKCRRWTKIQKPANAGKKRRKMGVAEMLKQPHYMSILNFTWLFGDNQGLRQLHYRWELIKNHDGIKSTRFVEEMKEFFKEAEVKKFLLSHIFTKTYISSRSNLTNFLKKLVENDLLCKVAGPDRISIYFLTDKSEAYLLRHNLIELIKVAPLSYIEKNYYELSKKIIEDEDFIISDQKTDKLFESTKEEVEEILKTDLKDKSEEEKKWIRKNIVARKKNGGKK
jgi:hypothetical protein